MMKLRYFTILAFCIIAPTVVNAYVNVRLPFAALEYNATDAVTLHGSAESFSSSTPILLNDVTAGVTTFWLDATVTSIATLRGFAHLGEDSLVQATANARIDKIQIWRWADSNGDGIANVEDARIRGNRTTKWTKVYEIDPDSDDAAIADGNVIGWNITNPEPAQETDTWQGNLLQGGSTLTVKTNNSYLFIIRVVDTSGNINLDASLGGAEQWDNGDTSDGIGSDIAADKYLDSDGNTPGTSDARIEDDDVVWTHVQRD